MWYLCATPTLENAVRNTSLADHRKTRIPDSGDGVAVGSKEKNVANENRKDSEWESWAWPARDDDDDTQHSLHPFLYRYYSTRAI